MSRSGARGPSAVQDALRSRLDELWGCGVEVTRLRRLSGGTSRETWTLDAVDGRGVTHQLIAYLDPRSTTDSPRLRIEALALAAAREHGVAVPRVVDTGDATGPTGSPYLLVERLAGETIPRRLLRDQEFDAVRPRLAAEFGTMAARIHGIDDPRLVESLPRRDDPIAAITARYGLGRPPTPAAALAIRWLTEHPVPPGPRGVVHGDFRLGNMLITPDGVSAVLDWEIAHVGDVLEDLGWLCTKVWRFGSERPAGGVGSRTTLLDAYERESGWRPSDAQLHWWELFGTVQWGLMCRSQANRHLGGGERSVELAAIGRRACEQDFDALLALGLAAPEPAADVLREPPSHRSGAPHTRPTDLELLEAVTEFLQASVVPGGGATGFHGRVAANVVNMVRRQLTLGEAQRDAHRSRLHDLGCRDDDELSEAITSGAFDDRHSEVVVTVVESVRAQLLVANPKHLRIGDAAG